MIRNVTLEEESFMCLEEILVSELLEDMKDKLTPNTYLIYKRALKCIDVNIKQENFYAYMRFLRERIIYHAHKHVS